MSKNTNSKPRNQTKTAIKVALSLERGGEEKEKRRLADFNPKTQMEIKEP